MTENRSPDEVWAAEERRADIVRRRRRGEYLHVIGAEYGISKQRVHQIVQEALELARSELALSVEEMRQLENEKLDAAERAMLVVAEREHVTVSHGKIIIDERTGEPLLDDAPVLAAEDRLARIRQRRAALNGLDVPVKQAVDLGGTVNYVINGVDPSKLT